MPAAWRSRSVIFEYLFDLWEEKFHSYRFEAQEVRVHQNNTVYEYDDPDYFRRFKDMDSFLVVPKEDPASDQIEFFKPDSVEVSFEDDRDE